VLLGQTELGFRRAPVGLCAVDIFQKRHNLLQATVEQSGVWAFRGVGVPRKAKLADFSLNSGKAENFSAGVELLVSDGLAFFGPTGAVDAPCLGLAQA
jgi:hypothetical protein